MCAKKLSELTYDDDKLVRNKEFGDGVLSLIENSERITDNKSLVLAWTPIGAQAKHGFFICSRTT